VFIFIILLDNEAQILFILKVYSSCSTLIVSRTTEAFIAYLKFWLTLDRTLSATLHKELAFLIVLSLDRWSLWPLGSV